MLRSTKVALLGSALVVAMLVFASGAGAAVYYNAGSTGHEGVYKDSTLLVSGQNLEGVTLMGGYVYYTWFTYNNDHTTQSYLGRIATDGTHSEPTFETFRHGFNVIGDLIVSGGGSALYFIGGTYTETQDGEITHTWIGQLTALGTYDPEWTDLGERVNNTGNAPANVFGLGGDPQGDVYWAYGCGIGKITNGGSVNKTWLAPEPCEDGFVGITGSATNLYIARTSVANGRYIEKADLNGNVQNASFITGLGSAGGYPQLAIWKEDLWVTQAGIRVDAFTPNGEVAFTNSPGYGPGTTTAADADPGSTVGPVSTTTVVCSPNPVRAGSPTTCTTTVTQGQTPPPAGTPSPMGNIYLESSVTGTFPDNDPDCTLVPFGPGTSSCSIVYTPKEAGTAVLQANYTGSGSEAGASGVGQTKLAITAAGTTTTEPGGGTGDQGGSGSGSTGSGGGGSQSGSKLTPIAGDSTLTFYTPKVSGTTASVPLSCSGATACPATANLTAGKGSGKGVSGAARGGTVLAVDAGKPRGAAGSKRTVAVGSAKATIPAGSTRTLKVALNGAGKALLRSAGKLKVKLTVSEAGTIVKTATVTFTARK